ncbi:histone H2A.Z-specific chaperone CHZ1-like [Cynara cardunculus var. scolymus]|uniref:histone H2A.Z-specific chaperone CHZ1-like n=1 Tax=Cynara cardunculus var. scolymus TaxID=59895 RepID=UPI000D62E4DD|nr:histone H2A.Z-specific chaperone CHZ1-like [Cynara cardunculus var. scolymus]
MKLMPSLPMKLKRVAKTEKIDDAVKANDQDEDLPITSVADVGDKEDEDDDEDDEVDDPPSFPDAGKDLDGGDDEDDDDDDFIIQYHNKPASALIGVSQGFIIPRGERDFGKIKRDFCKEPEHLVQRQRSC